MEDKDPAYIRVSRSATEDVYDENIKFELNKANVLGEGKDVLLVACGEMTPYAKKAMEELNQKGISTGLIDMYCLKPYDTETLLKQAKDVKLVVELSLPDEHLISGTNKEMFAYYGLDNKGIVKAVEEAL